MKSLTEVGFPLVGIGRWELPVSSCLLGAASETVVDSPAKLCGVSLPAVVSEPRVPLCWLALGCAKEEASGLDMVAVLKSLCRESMWCGRVLDGML